MSEASGTQNVALICTRGFADVLTLGRQHRADPYAVHVGPSPWLDRLPPAWRIELPGRIDAAGVEVEPLDLSTLADRLRNLPGKPAAVVIALLFAPRNPAHERAVREAVARLLPGVPVHCSHAHDAAGAEYERTVATLRVAGCVLTTSGHSHAEPSGEQGFDVQVAAIADHIQAVLVDHAVSSVVREAMDCAAGIFLPDGRLVAQARTLPLLLGSLAPAVAGILAECPVAQMQPGEGFASNDPWRGGTHLPDVIVLRPVFAYGRVQALIACILHHQDVGGTTPGSLPPDARTVFEEGLRIPPLRLYRQDRVDPAILRLLTANSRRPEELAGNLQAQWAGLQAGDAALQRLLDAGDGFLRKCEAAIAASEATTRRALAAVPDGRWHYRDALDGDGRGDAAVEVAVTLVKQADTLTIDLTGCADQVDGPANASRGAVAAAVNYLARRVAPDAASNAGCLAPITVRTRPGTIVDPAWPAALNARTNLVKLLANALLGAWAQAVPGQVPAPNAGVAVVLVLSGTRADGRAWLFTEIIASGAGAAPWGPGGSGVSTDVGNARNTPAEVIEAQAPVRVERVQVRAGSGGAGRHAGGCGTVRAYHLLEGQGAIAYRGERHRTPAQGAAGGAPGLCGSARIERADGTVEQLPAKARAMWRAGDRLVVETAGAGGWGPPGDAGSEIA